MRVEVYIPPYLTDGRQQPSFTVDQQDWEYGGSYTIQVTLNEGTTDTMRVSLIAGGFSSKSITDDHLLTQHLIFNHSIFEHGLFSSHVR